MPDWQTICVLLIIMAAALYVGRRAWARLRSIYAGETRGASSRAESCGSCDNNTEASRPTSAGHTLIQIKSARRR